ncbi:MAG: hypothetical protein SchgKO_02070 [Schleiferiaceae bacterium]
MEKVIGTNIKTLRKRKRLSQEQLAGELSLTRSTLSAYENGTAEPNIQSLLRMGDYFSISIDRLLRQDLSTLPEQQLSEVERGLDVDVYGRQLRILTTALTPDDEELIEIIPESAKAGYTTGYADPEYVKGLPTISLPFLSKNRKHRAFPITGDSMPPVSEGSHVIAEYVQDWTGLSDGTPCIVITKEEGIVFKKIYNHIGERGTLKLVSTNPSYEPYEVHANEVIEVWKFIQYLSDDLPEPNLEENLIATTLLKLQREVDDLKRK